MALAQVPQQKNMHDCGVFVLYFMRALLEAPDWVKEVVQVQLVGQNLVKELTGSQRELEEPIARVMRWAWGEEVSLLRIWLRLTLLSWKEFGVPKAIEEPMELDND